MTKQEFLTSLDRALFGIDPTEKSRILQYYSELITDAVEEGEDENAFISKLDSIKAIADRVRVEQHVAFSKKKPGLSTGTKALIAVLSVFAAPIVLPLGIAFLAVIFAVCLTIGILLLCVVITAAAFIFAGVCVGAASFRYLFSAPAIFLFNLGISMLIIGLSILLLLSFIYLLIGFQKLIGKCFGSTAEKIYRKKGGYKHEKIS